MIRRTLTPLVGALLAALPPGVAHARRQPPSPTTGALSAGDVAVDQRGRVTIAGRRAGRIPLPPPPRALAVARPTVQGHKLVHVKVRGRGRRSAELLVTADLRATIFRGATGLQGVDAEWSLLLDVAATVLRYQRKDGVERCDGAEVYLFPEVYDFRQRRFRPVMVKGRRGGIPQLVAKRAAPALPRIPGLAAPRYNTFRWVAASTQIDDGGRAALLAAPAEADDGRLDTAWAEGRGSDGRGEFLTARRASSPYRIRALRIVPGDAKSAKSFARANRLKSVLLLLGPREAYRVVFPRDPLRDTGSYRQPYWVLLPRPSAARCATVVVESVFPGRLARGAKSGGRTAVSELQLLGELDLAPGAMGRLLRDLTAKSAPRRRAARAVLVRLGPAAIAPLARAIPRAKGRRLRRIVEVLARVRSPRVAGPLATALPRLGRHGRAAAIAGLARLGGASVPAVLPLFNDDARRTALRAALARLLGRVGGQQAMTALVARAGKGPRALRAGVVDGLARLAPSAALDPLLVATDAARGVRRADLILASSRLARRSPGRRAAVAARLARLWRPRSPFEVRYRLLRAVGRLDPAGQLPLLARAARAKDPVLRWLAIRAVGQLRSLAARRLQRGGLADRDPRVRAAAAAALGRAPRDPRVAGRLARALRRERWPLAARAVAAALGAHCTPEGTRALRWALGAGAPGVDVVALHALFRCRPPRLLDLLLRVAGRGRRVHLRRRAAALITPRLAGKEAHRVTALYLALRRAAGTRAADQQVAMVLGRTIGGFPGAEAPRVLADALALDPFPAIRAGAARGLARRCPAAALPTLRRAAAHDSAALVRQAARAALKRCARRRR